MRILLDGVDSIETLGGGFTLSQDIFHELGRVGENCKHRFFLVDHSATDSPQVRLPNNFTRIRIDRSYFRRVMERLLHESKVRIGLTKANALRGYSKSLQSQLIANRIDCALSLKPQLWTPTVPNIVTVFDLEHRRKPYFPELAGNGEWESRERYYRTFLPNATAVIIGTDVGKRQVEDYYGVDPAAITIIPFPTPSFASRAIESRNQCLPVELRGDFLFYPAQFWAHKNHIRLLQAMTILQQQHGWQGKLLCCGADHGNLNFIQKRATEFGLNDKVMFLGFVPKDQLILLYQKAFALTYVSYLGPDNLPPLEAFALGCPVIASAVEGARETLGAAALYIDPDNPNDIADAVARLKNEVGLRERLITAGRIRSAESTIEGYVRQLLCLLDALEARFECFRS